MKFFTETSLNVPFVFKQFIAIICCNLLVFAFAFLIGWATINSIDLQNENSEFPTGTLSLDEVSMVISLVNVGCFIGNFAVVFCAQTIGAKRTIHLFTLPLILSALLIIYAQNVYYLYASRVLLGLVAGGMPYASSTLINQICFSHIRGTLNAMYDPFLNFGCIVSFLFGNYLSGIDQAKVSLIVPCISGVILFLLPESPEYLAKRGSENQAIQSHKFYKGDSEEFEKNAAKYSENITNGRANATQSGETTNSKLTFKDFTTPEAKKACFIAFTMYVLSFLCGTYVLMFYVTDIFERIGSPISAKSSSLVISIINLIGNLSFLPIADRYSRKTLYVSSAIITAVWFFAFGTYCLVWLHRPGYEWMSLLFFACMFFSSTMGLLPISYMITMEIFPKKIRPVCLSSAICLQFLILYVYSLIFPIFLKNIEIYWCMFILGAICILNAIFGIIFTPDTRGKSEDEIFQLLSK